MSEQKIIKVKFDNHHSYQVGEMGVKEIKRTTHNGEMALVGWIEVFGKQGKIMDCHESKCLIFYDKAY